MIKRSCRKPIAVDLDDFESPYEPGGSDYEILEIVGYFHKEFALLPRKWVARHWNTWDGAPEDFHGPYCICWTRDVAPVDVLAYCDFFWPRGASNGQYYDDNIHQTAWIAENGHRLELTQNFRGKITELYICFDLRTIPGDFIRQVVLLAKAADCLLLDREEFKLFEPTVAQVTMRWASAKSARPLLYDSECQN